jgi:probable addiction module antidote protein
MAEKFSRLDVADYLQSDEDMNEYLQACIEEDSGDGHLIAAALGDIARAKNMAQLARDVNMSREGLYKALSGEGNPSFSTIIKVAKSLGLQIGLTTRAA